MFNGWINLNKQKGLSSAKATNYLKKIFPLKCIYLLRVDMDLDWAEKKMVQTNGCGYLSLG